MLNENQQQKNKATNNITHKRHLKLFIIRLIKKNYGGKDYIKN